MGALAVLTRADSPSSPDVAPSAVHLHVRPPLTPAGVLLGRKLLVPGLVVAFLALAVMAMVDGGSILLTWDEPVARAVHDVRSAPLDGAVRSITMLGGLTVVVTLLLVMLVLVWHQCRSLAWVLLAASAARPLLEWTLKSIVDRDRPALAQLVDGTGPSFPSGHVMAAVAIWGLLPPVVALVTDRRAAWWASVFVSGTVIALVAASRVYLGVHWFSDVVGALLLGSIYLLAVQRLLDWHHRRIPCTELTSA